MLMLLLSLVLPPHPTASCVYDPDGALARVETASIERTCERLDRANRAAIAVAIVHDLQGLDRPAYAAELFRAWGLGHRGHDDGLLILLALPPAPRGVKVEVGHGLEGVLNDGKAMAILRDEALHDLQAGRYGIALLTLMREYGAIAEQHAPTARREDGLPWWLFALGGGLVLLALIVWAARRRKDDPQTISMSDSLGPSPESALPLVGYSPMSMQPAFVPTLGVPAPRYEAPPNPPPMPSFSTPDPDPAPSWPDPSPPFDSSPSVSSGDSGGGFGGFDGGSSGGGGGDTGF